VLRAGTEWKRDLCASWLKSVLYGEGLYRFKEQRWFLSRDILPARLVA